MNPGSNLPCVSLLAVPLHVCSRLCRADSPATSASYAPWSRSHACMTKSPLSSFRGENHSPKQVCTRHGSIPYAFCCRFPPSSCGLLSAGRRCHGNVGRLMAGLGSGDVSGVIPLTRQSDESLGCNICTAAGATRKRENTKEENGSVTFQSQFSIHWLFMWGGQSPYPREGRWPPSTHGPEGTTEDGN